MQSFQPALFTQRLKLFIQYKYLVFCSLCGTPCNKMPV